MTAKWLRHLDAALESATAQKSLWQGNALRNCYTTVKINSWQAFQEFVINSAGGDDWLFRGQSDAKWGLRPSLERAALYTIKFFDQSDVDLFYDSAEIEYFLTREFKRRAHHFLTQVPGSDDELEWLALMQHYGAPTRLLDWTKSPYVAAYFAMSDVDLNGAASLWVINGRALWRSQLPTLAEDDEIEQEGRGSYLLRDIDAFRNFCYENPNVSVIPVQPFRTNERLTLQQGVFLCPGNLTVTFEGNLCAALARSDYGLTVYKLDVDAGLRLPFLHELNRMNINHATLFPGLDGFSVFLKNSIRLGGDIAKHEFERQRAAGE